MHSLALLLAAAITFAGNLVPEAKRAFDVPFKGEGKMGLQYVPVFFPKGTEGAVISCEGRITDVVRGEKSWFDARIMTDFINSQCKKVAGGPNIGGWKGTKDWFEVRKTVRVPEGAHGLALMPCLFNVKSGAMSVRKLSVEPQSKYVEDPAEKAQREAAAAKKAGDWSKRQARAKERLEKSGSIIPPQNGPYAKLVSTEPGKLVNAYKEYDVPAGIEAQTRQALNNIGAILEEAGLTFNDVAKTTVLLQDINDFAAMNAVYAEYFPQDKPARVCYQVAALPKGALTEIDAIAGK